MKKLITIFLLCALALSFAACGNGSDKKDGQTTSAVTETPANEPKLITLDEINGIIDSVKSEYATATEIKLSDGTAVTAEPKDPKITLDDVKGGTATKDQMIAYMEYMANIRIIARDRIASSYDAANILRLQEKDIDILFLNPKADGFDNAIEAYTQMYNNYDEDSGDIWVASDYVYMEKKLIAFFDKETNEVTLLCPSSEENALLSYAQSAVNE